jgi:hypothetical protein
MVLSSCLATGESFVHGNDETVDDNKGFQEKFDMRPYTIFISNVTRAWAKSDRIEAPEMAENLLALMQDLYKNGWEMKMSHPILPIFLALW